VWNWKHLFETQEIDTPQPKKKGRPSMKKDTKKTQPVEGSPEALLAEIERLRMENAYLKKLKALSSGKGKITEHDKGKYSMS
jgi:hypothetical protein